MDPIRCPSKNKSLECSGNGYCTDLNTCHCEVNFTGADCSLFRPLTKLVSAKQKNDLSVFRRSAFNSSHRRSMTSSDLVDFLLIQHFLPENQNEVVDNNMIQLVVIVMSILILCAMIGIMSSACCGRRARRLQTQNGINRSETRQFDQDGML